MTTQTKANNVTLQYRKHKRRIADTILKQNAPERFPRGADEDGARPNPPQSRKKNAPESLSRKLMITLKTFSALIN